MSKEQQYVNIVNRKARHDYSFLKTDIAGISLMGSEIKAIRESKVSLTDAFCIFQNGELFMKNAHIAENDTYFTHTALRERKLLMKKRELEKLEKELVKGLTIVPYRMFVNSKGLCKVEIALCKGKKDYDKRDSLKKKDIEREHRKENL